MIIVGLMIYRMVVGGIEAVIIMNDRAKEVINELKKERDDLLAENKSSRMRSMVDNDVGEIWCELRKLKKACIHDNAEVKSAKRMMKIACVVAVASWVILLFVFFSS